MRQFILTTILILISLFSFGQDEISLNDVDIFPEMTNKIEAVEIKPLNIIVTSSKIEIQETVNVVIPTVEKAKLVDKTMIEVKRILAASIVNASDIQINKIFEAIFATYSEIQINEIILASYIEDDTLKSLGFMNKSELRQLIKNMKLAKMSKNENEYFRLQDLLLKQLKR